MNLPIHPITISFADTIHAVAGIGSELGAPTSGLAFFLLGLITGATAAVAAFFVYLHISRTRRSLSHFDGREDLQEDFEEPADPHSHQQPRMPWERPDDWWRNDS